jgi:hypothetical protein
MEVPQIEETRLSAELEEAEHRGDVRSREPQIKSCVYDKEITCTAPDCKLEICSECPYGYNASLTSSIKDVFKKIVNLAIFLAKSDDVLRDVIALVSKARDMEQMADLGQKPKESKFKAEIKQTKNVAKTKLPAGNVKLSVASRKVRQSASSAQNTMSDQLSRKVADISEALANPDGSREKPLV